LKAALIKMLRRFAGRWPRLAFSLAPPLARVLQPLNRSITEERLAEVFPELATGPVRAARRRSWANILQAEALLASLGRPDGQRGEPEIVPNPDLAALRPPLILASFHVGIFPAVGAALARLPGDVLVVHRARFTPRPGFTLVLRGEDEWERARTFHRAVTSLRSGGFVFTTLDGGYGEDGYDAAAVDAPMLGGTISLARGGFALARITRTPIVPLVARRCGRRIEFSCGDPISPAQGEEAMAAAAAQWLGDYLLEFPGEISSRTLQILRSPAPGR
jgi:hypothetical protein